MNPDRPGYFTTRQKLAEFDYQGAPGVTYRPVVTPTTMLNFVSLGPHSEVARHQHVEEQIVYVIEGELDFKLDGVRQILKPGGLVVIPPWVWHGARTRDQACLDVDLVKPPRQALIDAVGGLSALNTVDELSERPWIWGWRPTARSRWPDHVGADAGRWIDPGLDDQLQRAGPRPRRGPPEDASLVDLEGPARTWRLKIVVVEPDQAGCAGSINWRAASFTICRKRSSIAVGSKFCSPVAM